MYIFYNHKKFKTRYLNSNEYLDTLDGSYSGYRKVLNTFTKPHKFLGIQFEKIFVFKEVDVRIYFKLVNEKLYIKSNSKYIELNLEPEDFEKYLIHYIKRFCNSPWY